MKDSLILEQQQQYFLKANQLLAQGNYVKAEEILDHVIQNAQQIDDIEMICKASIDLAKIYASSTRYQELYTLLITLEPYIQQQTETILTLQYRFYENILHYHYNPELTLPIIEQLLIEIVHFGNDELYMSVALQMLEMYLESGLDEKCIHLMNEMDNRQSIASSNNPIVLYTYYAAYAMFYTLQRDEQQLVEILDKMEQVLPSINESLTHYYFCGRAYYLALHEQFEEAKELFDFVLEQKKDSLINKIQMECWIQILMELQKLEEVIYYQGIFIQQLKNDLKKEERFIRENIIERLSFQKVQQVLYTDRVTRVKNRSFYEEIVQQKKQYTNYTVAIFDLDRFKAVNDHFGHLVGDQAIKCVATIAKKWRSKHDVEILRYGGDEFVILLPYQFANVKNELERLRKEVEGYAFEVFETGEVLKLTISIGVGYTLDKPTTIEDLFSLADDALYIAKKEGRNRMAAQNYDEIIS